MHGEAVLVIMVDGDMEWVLVDMGKLKNNNQNLSKNLDLNNFYFSGWGGDNDNTIINN
jgi:hypothetical protein